MIPQGVTIIPSQALLTTGLAQSDDDYACLPHLPFALHTKYACVVHRRYR